MVKKFGVNFCNLHALTAVTDTSTFRTGPIDDLSYNFRFLPVPECKLIYKHA